MAGSPGPTKHSPDFSYSRWEFPARGCLSSQSALRKQFANDELFGAPAKTRGWNTVSTADFEGLQRSRPCGSCRMSGNPEVVREGRPVSGLPTIHPRSDPPTVYQPIERLSGFGRRQPISDNFAFREVP